MINQQAGAIRQQRRIAIQLLVAMGLFILPITASAALHPGKKAVAEQPTPLRVIAKRLRSTARRKTSMPTAKTVAWRTATHSHAETTAANAIEQLEARVRQLETQLASLSETMATLPAKPVCDAAIVTALPPATTRATNALPVTQAKTMSNTTATNAPQALAAPVFAVTPEMAAPAAKSTGATVAPAVLPPAAPRVKLSVKPQTAIAKLLALAMPGRRAHAMKQANQANGQAATPVVAPAPAAVNTAATGGDDSSTLNFFREVEVSGIIDGYYTYNSNRTDLGAQGRVFDIRHNAFSLQMARVAFDRKNSKESPFGFRVELAMGEGVDRVISVSDSQRNDGTKYILQAYGSYVAPIGNGLTLDFGKFYTPVGGEVIDAKDNFNYTRSFLYWYGGPYYHMGLRAKYAFNDKVSVTGLLVNGWDNVFPTNLSGGKTIGGQLTLAPNKRFSVTQSYLVGKEAPLANVPDVSHRDNVRHLADTLATWYVNDKLSLMSEYLYGSDGDDEGERGSWHTAAGYLRYAFNDRLAFSPRIEFFRDKGGLRTGIDQMLKGVTLTQEVKLVKNFITRFEFRHDISNQKFFVNHANQNLNRQTTFTIGLSYSFSTKE